VQTIIIGTIVTLIVFILGVIINHLLKNGDNEACSMKYYAKMDGIKVNNNVDASRKCDSTRVVFLTADSTTLTPANDNSTKITGLLLVGSAFSLFYVMIILCLARRQTRVRQRALVAFNEEINDDVQNLSSNIQKHKIVLTEFHIVPESNV
jgi:hypothetical protein